MAGSIDFEADGTLSEESLGNLDRLGPVELGQELTALVERMVSLDARRRRRARIGLERAIVAGSRGSGRIDVRPNVPRLVELFREASIAPDGLDLASVAARLLATTDRATILRSIPINSAGLELRVRLGRALDEAAGVASSGGRASGSRSITTDVSMARPGFDADDDAAPDEASFPPPAAAWPPAAAPPTAPTPTHAKPPAPAPPSVPANGGPVAAEAETYKAYGVLACDELVLVGESFPLTVGLGPEPAPGVSGPPMMAPVPTKPYDLEIQLFADGFDVAPGESLRNTLEVSDRQRFPTIVLHLTARDMPNEMADREISAAYVIGGEPLGAAQRNIRVTKDAAEVADRAAPVGAAAGTNLTAQPGAPKADLSIMIKRGLDAGTLQWSVTTTVDGVHPSRDIPSTDIGQQPVKFAKNLIGQISQRENSVRIFNMLEGIGDVVARQIPDEVIAAIRAAHDAIKPAHLQILILTDEPFVPWELAVLDPPLDPALPPYLGAQTTIGRWVIDPHISSDLNRDLMAKTMAVVSGVFEQRLLAAEDEARRLGRKYRARKVDASIDPILSLLKGQPPADIIHFAVHGKYDTTGYDEGIVLISGPPLLPLEISAGELHDRAPFVFLNACQLGSSAELLGDYYGTAMAFLQAGACAVVAPLWSVNDDIANEIALEFYRRALAKPRGKDGQPPLVADLLRDVRMGIVDHADKLSATYLAYQFYGHPSLRLSWAPTPSGRDTDG